MASDENIGRNVRGLREALGLSQAQLAERVGGFGLVGIYPSTVAKIENGTRSLKLAEANAFSRALRCLEGDLTRATDVVLIENGVRGALHGLVGGFERAVLAHGGLLADLEVLRGNLREASEQGVTSPPVVRARAACNALTPEHVAEAFNLAAEPPAPSSADDEPPSGLEVIMERLDRASKTSAAMLYMDTVLVESERVFDVEHR